MIDSLIKKHMKYIQFYIFSIDELSYFYIGLKYSKLDIFHKYQLIMGIDVQNKDKDNSKSIFVLVNKQNK